MNRANEVVPDVNNMRNQKSIAASKSDALNMKLV
jgi:hypothetical protein